MIGELEVMAEQGKIRPKQSDDTLRREAERENAECLVGFLRVGEDVFLEVRPGMPGTPRLRTVLRGWHSKSFLLFDMPVSGSGPPLRHGQECAVRFVRDGEVMGFRAIVLKNAPRGEERFLQIKWPTGVQRVCVRRNERVAIELSCMIRMPDRSILKGAITDLSAGGCAIRTHAYLRQEEVFEISFCLPDGGKVKGLSARVCKESAHSGRGFLFGCVFLSNETEDRFDISFAVARLLARQRQDRPTHPMVLLLSEDQHDVERAQAALNPAGCEVLSATDLLDAGFKLHSYPCKALLVDGAYEALPVGVMCASIRKTGRYRDLPILVYGAKPGEASEKIDGVFHLESLGDAEALRRYALDDEDCLIARPTEMPASSSAAS
jgi:hypothetical protein